jgi:predicted transcriptional regulator
LRGGYGKGKEYHLKTKDVATVVKKNTGNCRNLNSSRSYIATA